MTASSSKRGGVANHLPDAGASDKPTGPAPEPAQGSVDTQARYRDRPTDDGKYGDGDAEPAGDELQRKSAER